MIEGKDYEIIDGHLRIFEGVTEIKEYEFKNKDLTSVEIPGSVITIGCNAFANNKIECIEIPQNVTTIGYQAFGWNNLTSVNILSSKTLIGEYAFVSNKLTSIKIPEGVINIGEGAFSENELISVKLSNNIKVITRAAFANNKLSQVKIPDNVKVIEEYAFASNDLTSVNIPASVVRIEKCAFDNIDIIYDGILVKKELVEKYGCEHVIKLHEILKLIPKEKIMEIPKEILEVIPTTEEALKGYIANKKTFELFADPNIYKKEEYQDIFKLCFTLGLFNKPEQDNIKFIIKILHDNNLDYIHQMFTAVTLTSYKPKFKDLFMKLYEESKTDYNENNIIGRLYTSFEKINKFTIKRHEDIISKKNTEIKRLKELGANTTLLEQKLEILKTNKKNISYEDIVYYIKNNTFEIRDGNEDLKDVVDTLAVHIEQEGFDKIQDIYEESIDIGKAIPLTNDISGKDIKYHWSKSDNPINTILGYLVNCCAKLGGAGEDIMRQSMINPDVANLIIYDENNQVMGKATAYYNRKGKYILFNNAETKEITSKGLKSEKQRQKECLEALIRGTMDAVNVLKEKGEDIKEVRIGMLRNDLAEAIEDYGLEISYDLLDAYSWKDYTGDASDVDEGQAIIYKDDELDKNRKI